MSHSRETQYYFDIANQYYVAGRYSAIVGFLPVAGNLFHHAIEMYLKGYLTTKGLTETEFIRDFRHDLVKLWNKFKSEASDSTLEQFNKMIEEVNKFDSIRYPEKITKKGMTAFIGFERGNTWVEQGYGTPPEQYNLVVKEIDTLIFQIYEKTPVNPKFFSKFITSNPDIKKYLTLYNDETPRLFDGK